MTQTQPVPANPVPNATLFVEAGERQGRYSDDEIVEIGIPPVLVAQGPFGITAAHMHLRRVSQERPDYFGVNLRSCREWPRIQALLSDLLIAPVRGQRIRKRHRYSERAAVRDALPAR